MNKTERMNAIKAKAERRMELFAEHKAEDDKDMFNLQVLESDVWPGSLYARMGMDITARRALKALQIVKNMAESQKIPDDWETRRILPGGVFEETE